MKKSFSGDLLIPSVVTSVGGVTYLSMLGARQPSKICNSLDCPCTNTLRKWLLPLLQHSWEQLMDDEYHGVDVQIMICLCEGERSHKGSLSVCQVMLSKYINSCEIVQK